MSHHEGGIGVLVVGLDQCVNCEKFGLAHRLLSWCVLFPMGRLNKSIEDSAQSAFLNNSSRKDNKYIKRTLKLSHLAALARSKSLSTGEEATKRAAEKSAEMIRNFILLVGVEQIAN